LRAVLDANVIIAALISSSGSPARLLEAWRAGRFELIVSVSLLDELERALAYPNLRRRISAEDAAKAIAWLRRDATMLPDPSGDPPVRSVDPGDDYLIALAAAGEALLVSGDDHLLSLGMSPAVLSPSAFLTRLAEASPE
jgi:putative PIN family toxin of toxin-antitoxin system